MKPNAFVPKDGSGNEESRCAFCLRPISCHSWQAWETAGGVNQNTALAYFPPQPEHLRAPTQGAWTSRFYGSWVTTNSQVLGAHDVLSAGSSLLSLITEWEEELRHRETCDLSSGTPGLAARQGCGLVPGPPASQLFPRATSETTVRRW